MLDGGEWNDDLWAGDGNDTLFGGDFFDVLHGGTGNDSLLGGDGVDTLYAEDGNDTLNGGGDVDQMFGGLGDDKYVSVEDQDLITEFAYEGYDTVYTNDTIFNSIPYVEQFILGDSNKSFYGRYHDELISGGKASQFISSEGGNDTIYGNGGNDTIYGGLGSDIFCYYKSPFLKTNVGNDYIGEFDCGKDGDKIRLSGFFITDFIRLMANAVETGTGTTLSLSASESIFLSGIKKSQLTANNFEFL